MRVVAGSARGRRLVAPPGTTTRPTSDRAREGIFNMVASRVNLDGARVVDLFAGSGAMGIEALSRGAAHATFVENHRPAVEAIRTNLATLGFDDVATVISSDVMAWSSRRAADRAHRDDHRDDHRDRHRDGEGTDVVFADPPYSFDEWRDLAAAFSHCDLFVAESDRAVDLGEGWGLLTERRYGGTVVVLASPSRKVNP